MKYSDRPHKLSKIRRARLWPSASPQEMFAVSRYWEAMAEKRKGLKANNQSGSLDEDMLRSDAALAAGLECVRADEIVHSGNIQCADVRAIYLRRM
jgi:hypothetical protein